MRTAADLARLLARRGIGDERVLKAIAAVPRELFVPDELRRQAYADRALPIGSGQTISQPYMVATIAAALELRGGERVLDVGTGSGYQAAVLAELAREVWSVEIVPELAERSRAQLAALGYTNVHVRAGDGYLGWKEHAPYDAIVVTAAPDHVPPALVEQLAVGGHLVIPVGRGEQEMRVLRKTATGVLEQVTIPVRFVPLVRPDTGRR